MITHKNTDIIVLAQLTDRHKDTHYLYNSCTTIKIYENKGVAPLGINMLIYYEF